MRKLWWNPEVPYHKELRELAGVGGVKWTSVWVCHCPECGEIHVEVLRNACLPFDFHGSCPQIRSAVMNWCCVVCLTEELECSESEIVATDTITITHRRVGLRPGLRVGPWPPKKESGEEEEEKK